MWKCLVACLFLAVSTNAYSSKYFVLRVGKLRTIFAFFISFVEYGRSCKDIGCLNSEECVMAEDPCSFGRSSDCGTYPTCKKKSASSSGNKLRNN